MGKLLRVLSRISSESRSPGFLALKLIPHIRGLIFGEASKRLLLKIIIKKFWKIHVINSKIPIFKPFFGDDRNYFWFYITGMERPKNGFC